MKSFRPDKMASLIRTIVSDMIANRLQDPRVDPFTSVTRVEVSGDLQLAKIYISVMGSDADERRTMAGLKHAKGHIQRAIAHGITARHCPVVQFYADGSLKKAAEIIRIIDENVPRPIDAPTSEDPADDEDDYDAADNDSVEDDAAEDDAVENDAAEDDESQADGVTT